MRLGLDSSNLAHESRQSLLIASFLRLGAHIFYRVTQPGFHRDKEEKRREVARNIASDGTVIVRARVCIL